MWLKASSQRLFEEKEAVHFIGLNQDNRKLDTQSVLHYPYSWSCSHMCVWQNLFCQVFQFIFKIYNHIDLFPHETFDSLCEVDGDLMLVLIASNTDAEVFSGLSLQQIY